jgi:hypothetical protein
MEDDVVVSSSVLLGYSWCMAKSDVSYYINLPEFCNIVG